MFKPTGYIDEPCEHEQFRQSGDPDANPLTLNPASSVIRVGLIILLRAGFLIVQIGNIPVSDVNLILLHNIIEICWVSLCYILIGSTIAFTGNFAGVIGGGYWIGHEKTDREKALIGWQSAVVASGISTCCLAGRMHTVGTLIIGAIFSGIAHPLIMHWAWSTDGWMLQNRLREEGQGFYDSGGGALVHSTGSLTGLIGCLVLGRRIHGSQLNASPASTLVSYFFILVGLQV
uniref:Ammonium transporter AmtB-like domain-containing protein n=1 Tax=Bracon brevicornis TaxID=1563983 RepID=A0A6V7MFR8_9HYME